MSARQPLLSRDWYRVAAMRPRLRRGVRVSRQRVRGETWYVLSDPVSGRHHRFNDIAYALIASCDGEVTLDDAWAARVAAEGDAAPSQAETIRIVAQAFAANLLVGNVAPDAAAIIKTQSRRRSRRRRGQLNPLAFRVPMWNPDSFLRAQVHRVAWLYGPVAAALIGLVIAAGALLLALNAGLLADFARDNASTGRMLLLMWLAYPAMKALHELAHAFAVRKHGGEVHEMGITLLLLTPVPYVDASASVAFADKRSRIAVAAAGIVVEALLASLALILWLLLEPGLAKDLAFAVVLIGALSTVIVNGNPLLRFDGYYVLCDAAELPNLALRSTRYWQILLKRRLLGLHHLRFTGLAPGERPWLLAYAPLSWIYRAVMLGVLALVAAEWSGALGVAALALGAWWLLLKPGFAALRWWALSGEVRGHRPRAALAGAAALAVLGALFFGLPLPQRTLAPGVVWLPEDALVRLGSDGFVEEFAVRDGDAVQAGALIARLRNESLEAELAGIEAQLDRQTIERAQHFGVDARRAAAAQDRLTWLGAERDRLRERLDALTVRAGIAGRVVIDPRRVVPGQYLPQGEVIAQVLPGGAPVVRALVSNDDIALVRERPGAIGVRLALAGGTVLPAVLDRAVPRASTDLPSPALGDAAGGSIALDTSDARGLTAREPRFQIDLKLAPGTDAHVGARALVSFRHGDASAAELAGRFVRLSFLRHFER
jgi:putative peptide zinc metalloprotease protein